MKTINRNDLDTLAKRLTTLATEELLEFTGGYKYYNYNGEYLGDFGITDQIRLLDMTQSEFNDALEMGTLSSGDGQAFYEADLNIRANILSYIARESGLISGQFAGVNVIVEDLGDPTKAAAAANGSIGEDGNYSGTIYINTNSNLFTEGLGANYYDLQLTIKHEMNHIATPSDFGSNKSEYEAWLTVVKDPNIIYTSKAYYDNALKKYREYYNAYKKDLEDSGESFEHLYDPSLIPNRR